MTYTSILNFVNNKLACSMKHKKRVRYIHERAGIKQRPALVNAIFRKDNFLE